MPYTAEHKARTRARIIESARVMFNRHGFDQVSIDDIMKAAGLTRGGFYNHFASKDDLYAEAIRSFASCNPFATELEALDRLPNPTQQARMLAELYLSDAVLEDITLHCPLIALPSDVARAGLEPRAAYTLLVRNMLAIFQAAFSDDPRAMVKAQIAVNLCVGGMVIARTTDDRALRRSLRASALDQIIALLEGTKGRRRELTPRGRSRRRGLSRNKPPQRGRT